MKHTKTSSININDDQIHIICPDISLQFNYADITELSMSHEDIVQAAEMNANLETFRILYPETKRQIRLKLCFQEFVIIGTLPILEANKLAARQHAEFRFFTKIDHKEDDKEILYPIHFHKYRGPKVRHDITEDEKDAFNKLLEDTCKRLQSESPIA